jgi:hypothetical protein
METTLPLLYPNSPVTRWSSWNKGEDGGGGALGRISEFWHFVFAVVLPVELGVAFRP